MSIALSSPNTVTSSMSSLGIPVNLHSTASPEWLSHAFPTPQHQSSVIICPTACRGKPLTQLFLSLVCPRLGVLW